MLENVNYAQRERLAYIDFCLEYQGQIARSDLIDRFKTGLASCSRDLALYKEIAPDNAELKHETKKYFRSEKFSPVFQHDPENVLKSLSSGFGDGISQVSLKSEICFDAIRLIHPNTKIIGAIMRAIHTKSLLSCKYESLSSGTTERLIIPHAIINNGHRWHVRAFDRKSNSFRDFVCTRFTEIELISDEISKSETSEGDETWNNVIQLQIEAHPNLPHKRAIEMDYGMINGVLNISVRESIAGYLLRQWNVDSSPDGLLTGSEYQLKLKNPEVLKGSDAGTLAPGFTQK